jgi:long-chain fatty acid transport protein
MRVPSARALMAGIAVMCVIVAPTDTFGQTTAGINAGIQFDFSLPGARSLAMAGAFVAVADDATAAQANPAGLTILAKPEISVEGRGWNYFSKFAVRGHEFGPPTGVGIDTIDGIVDDEIKDTKGALSFLSFVYPRGNLAFAGYLQQFSKFKNRTAIEGPFVSYPNGDVRRINPTLNEINIDIRNYGFSIAGRVTPNLSIGGGIAISDFSIESLGQAYLIRPNGVAVPPAQRPQFTAPGFQYGPADFSDPQLFFIENQFGDDVAVAATVGALWKVNDQWNVGAAFRQGPDFKFDATFFGGPAHNLIGSPLAGVQIDDDKDILFHTPDSYSVGVAYSPNDIVKISVEYNRVQYSQLLDGTGEGLPVDTAGRLQFPVPAIQEEGRLIQEGLTLDSVNNFRVGSEIVLRRSPQPIFLRLGTWFDPAHQVYFVDTENKVDEVPNLRGLLVGLPKGDDEWHFSTGLGITFSRFQIDGGVDLSPRVNTISVSAVFFLR